MAKGTHEPGKHDGKGGRHQGVGEGRRSMNPPYPVTGPQTGSGRKSKPVGRKPHRAEIAQRKADGSILYRITRALWG